MIFASLRSTPSAAPNAAPDQVQPNQPSSIRSLSRSILSRWNSSARISSNSHDSAGERERARRRRSRRSTRSRGPADKAWRSACGGSPPGTAAAPARSRSRPAMKPYCGPASASPPADRAPREPRHDQRRQARRTPAGPFHRSRSTREGEGDRAEEEQRCQRRAPGDFRVGSVRRRWQHEPAGPPRRATAASSHGPQRPFVVRRSVIRLAHARSPRVERGC